MLRKFKFLLQFLGLATAIGSMVCTLRWVILTRIYGGIILYESSEWILNCEIVLMVIGLIGFVYFLIKNLNQIITSLMKGNEHT